MNCRRPLFLLAFATFERKDVLLRRQSDFARFEAGERDRDLETALIEKCDVVGRVRFLAYALGGFSKVEKTIEPMAD